MDRREVLKYGLLLVCGGCGQKQFRLLDELPDPIVHVRSPRRPAPIAAHPTRPTPKPPVHAAKGWMPARGISPRWECIVVHHSASDESSPYAMDRYHRDHNGWDELGYHLVIGNGIAYPDGKVFVGSRWTKQKHGAHCKTPDNFYNDHGIGICLIGNFEQSHPTPAQMHSLAQLCHYLTNQSDISLIQIHTHREITGKTLCPGRNFHPAELKARLNALA